MNATPKKKLCWNCEASVALHEENCPYCAVYLGPASVSGEYPENDPLAPPYKIQVMEDEETPQAPYAAPQEDSDEDAFDLEDDAEESAGIKDVALPMALLLGGTVFFLFGLVLLIFSENGLFTLRWNGDYWYFYQFLALPMLFFGWRALQQLEARIKPEMASEESRHNSYQEHE